MKQVERVRQCSHCTTVARYRPTTTSAVILRRHHINMQPVATDGVAWSVCLSVGHVHEPCNMAIVGSNPTWGKAV